MEHVIILTQSVPIEDGNHSDATQELAADVNFYLRGGWHPKGGPACGQVAGRFVVIWAMTREEEAEPDA